MRRSPASLALSISACLVIVGCGQAADEPDGRDSGRYATSGTFTMTLTGDPGGFDPYRGSLTSGALYLAYDSLVNLQADGQFVSGLAEHWTVTAESATFTLRPDVTCSDGTPLTAEHVAAAISYVSDPGNGSPQYGVNTPAVPLTVTAEDDARTVTVSLEGETFGFLLETVGQLPIVCPRGLEDPALLESASDGTGPFVLSEVVPGQSYTFIKREDYVWGPAGASTSEPGTPSKVVLQVVTSETTAANLLLSGDLNFAFITGADGQRLIEQGLDKIDWPLSGAWLWFNQLGERPFADQRVRQALVQALDLEQVIKVNTAGAGEASTGLVTVEPKPCPGDTVAGRLPEYDKTSAEALLDEAGWVEGADGMRMKDDRALAIDLHYSASGSPLNKPTAELLAEYWRSIGVAVELSGDTSADLSRVMFESGDYDVYMQGFGYSLPTQAVPHMSGPIPPDGRNFAGIANEDYDQMVARASGLTPPDACAYWDRAEYALWRDLDIVPIANRPASYFMNNATAEIAGWRNPIPTSIRVLN